MRNDMLLDLDVCLQDVNVPGVRSISFFLSLFFAFFPINSCEEIKCSLMDGLEFTFLSTKPHVLNGFLPQHLIDYHIGSVC